MSFLSEDDVEQARLDALRELGYTVLHGDAIGPESATPERSCYADVILRGRLDEALRRLNPKVSQDVLDQARQKITDEVFPSSTGLIEENHRIHRLLTEGVDIECQDKKGAPANVRVKYFDFENVDNNDWLAVNQFTVIENKKERRADVVIFINGLPLCVDELKNPKDEDATLEKAFYQLKTYKKEIPSLFRTNALLLVSDGMLARYGSLSSSNEWFMPWREESGQHGDVELLTMTKGLFPKERLLDIMVNFTMFQSDKSLIKVIAGSHQYRGVREALKSTIMASSENGDQKGGVVWHTQGSGKSFLMTFYAGALSKNTEMGNPTIVVLTDRADLDTQLFSTFSKSIDLLRQTPVQAKGRNDLKELLNRPAGGIIFTTLQKFEETSDPICERRNVVVVADEAHRSQYGFDAKIDRETGEITYGFAKHLRDALPSATFIGFTGTPIENDDINTRAVFGDYVDVYDISQAVRDGNTVPIFYESRIVKLAMDESALDELNEQTDSLIEKLNQEEKEQVKQKWASVEALARSDRRVEEIAKDLVEHFEKRQEALKGKAMFVGMSRTACVKVHDEIVKLRPDWYSADDSKGKVKIVMTGATSDPEEWQEHIGGGSRQKYLATRTKNEDDELNLIIVCDMWLTGFDCPSMHTLYVDKPMHGHGLMQAIARVNRVFRDKPAGLVVDYIGVAQNLKQALRHYSGGDQKNTGIIHDLAVDSMMEQYDIVSKMFHGFDYKSALKGNALSRLSMMGSATNWILAYQMKQAKKELLPDAKKKAQRRFQDGVLRLGKAYALSSTSSKAQSIRDEVGFFQAICGIIEKGKTQSGDIKNRERDRAVQQIISKAVISAEITDLLKLDGISGPDISILSDNFLDMVRKTEEPYLATEALRRLINNSIISRGKTNVVQARALSERLKNAMARYHSNGIDANEVLEELIGIAQDIRKALAHGQETGLSEDEIAFYDALAQSKSAVDLLGDAKLRLIAHEVLTGLRNNVSVDWAKKESTRAKMRVLVKRVLRKYGYPPDMQDDAVKTVLQQAEVLLSEIRI